MILLKLGSEETTESSKEIRIRWGEGEISIDKERANWVCDSQEKHECYCID